MKVIIPVAGKGTRLRPFTHSKPKPLVHLAGRRVLEHIIDQVLPVCPEEFIIIHDQKNGEPIKSFLRKKYPELHFVYALQEKQVGNAHAVYQAQPFINEQDDVLVVFCDTLITKDLRCIEGLQKDHDGVLFTNFVLDPQNYGIITHQDSVATGIVEKPEHPPSNLAAVGVYYFRNGHEFINEYIPKIFSQGVIRGEELGGVADALAIMIAEDKKFKVEKGELRLDCGTNEKLLEANRYFLRGGTYFGEHVKIDGESKIGSNVSIGDNTTLISCKIEDSIIGENTHLEGLVISGSIIGDNVEIRRDGQRYFVGDDSKIF
jgi:glucose-1-phosphate thymidylyltransferase